MMMPMTTMTMPMDEHAEFMSPNIQSCGYPLFANKKKPMSPRSRRVAFASNLVEEATIPSNWWQPLDPTKPPPVLMLSELRECVETLLQEVCDEHQAVAREREILRNYKQEFKTLKRIWKDIASTKKQVIQDHRCKCDKLDHTISKLKMEIQNVKEQSLVGHRRKRCHAQGNLYSYARQ